MVPPRDASLACLLIIACAACSRAPRARPPAGDQPSADRESERTGIRFRYEIEAGGDLSVVDLVVVLASEGNTVGLLSMGEEPAVRFRMRERHLAEDLGTALGVDQPAGPSTLPPPSWPEHAGWVREAAALAWSSAVMARVRAGFPDRWEGPAFERGSRWSRGGLTVRADEPCDEMGTQGRTFLLAGADGVEVRACFAPDLDLPLAAVERWPNGATRHARLTALRRFRPRPFTGLLGSWLNVTPRASGFPRGFVLNPGGSSVSFAWRRPEDGSVTPDPPPGSYCEDEVTADHWDWDGARLLVGCRDGWPTICSQRPHRLVGDGEEGRLQSPIGIHPSPGRDHTEHRKFDARSRGRCDVDVWPSVHERLADSPSLPVDLVLEGRDEHQDTPLSWAAARGHLALVQELVRRGARLDVRNRATEGPIQAAAHGGHLEVVRALLPVTPASPEVAADVTNALAAAALIGRIDIASYLLERGADLNGCVPRTGKAPADVRCDVPPLLAAARGGQLKTVAWLLGQGATVNLPGDDNYSRALVAAAGSGNDALVAFLMEKGARVGRPALDKWKYHAPIAFALSDGHQRIAGRIAVAAGFDADGAARRCDAGLLRIVLAFDPGQARGAPRMNTGTTLLQAATRCRNPDVARALLDAGADPNASSPADPSPPLAIAVENGSSGLVEQLLARGARASGVDGRGISFTSAAVEADRRDLYELLVRAGAPPLPGRELSDGRAGLRVADALASPPAVSPFDDDDPVYPGPGFRRPLERDPGCLQRQIEAIDGLPRDRDVEFKLAVGRDGRVSRVTVSSLFVPRRFDGAVRGAIRACAFAPGADASGREASLWLARSVRPSSLPTRADVEAGAAKAIDHRP